MSFANDCATSRRDPQVLSTFEQAGGLNGSDLRYVGGTSSRPLLGMPIGEAFDAAAGQWGEKTALVIRHQHIRRTYAELAARVDPFAAGLFFCDRRLASAFRPEFQVPWTDPADSRY